MTGTVTPLEVMYRGMAEELGTCGSEEFLSHAEAALSALEAAGYAVAPLRATEDMASAGAAAAGGGLSPADAGRVYAVMLAVAPG